jgi:5,6-dimethylbenzimidazole synthase
VKGVAVKLALGLGCDRGTPADTIARAVDQALAQLGAGLGDVAAVASIDLKADEAGLLALAEARGWTLRFYPAAELAAVAVPNPSETVRRYTGSPSVSEAAALLAAGAGAGHLLLEKYKLKGEDGRHATVSVARLAEPDAPVFGPAERDAVLRVLAARRDVRHFQPGASIPEEVRQRLWLAAWQAPSVGMMQAWKLLRITDPALRQGIAELVAAERLRTAQALGPRAAEFLALKVEGVRECAELWVMVLRPDDGTVFGRRTLPREMALCSTACAIENLWLAARAENLGLGWVSLFEPAAMAVLLGLPAGAQALAVLCLGPAARFHERPMLEIENWRQRRPPADFVGENRWTELPAPTPGSP